MEQSVTKTENQTGLPDISPIEITTSVRTNRKPLRDWGHEQAGLNRGDAAALECHLRWIREGHIVDETYNEHEEFMRKKNIQDEITVKEKEKSDKEKDQGHITDVLITDKENQIKELRERIEDKRIQMAEGAIQSTYSGARFWLYVSLCILISVYLIFFYSSAINASFFRNMAQMVNNASSGDITLMLNSIFDDKGIFTLGPQLIFTYLGAFIFFGFGLLPHIFHHEKSKYSLLKVVAAIIICLIIDALLAYKIDSGIHELKMMMGIADPAWMWYKSVNFYLVLAFGFGTYLLWGFIYEASIAEHEKKNVNAKTGIEIKGLKKRIRELENEIIKNRATLIELQKQIESLQIEIEALKRQLEQASLRPEELKRNMEQFYAGWLVYLNGTSEQNVHKETCETVYRQFQESLNLQLNHQLN